MKRKMLLSPLLLALLLVLTTFTALANPRVMFNGEYVDAEAIIVDGRTFLQARDIVELLGGTIDWDGDTRQVTITQDDTNIVLTIDDSAAIVNGTPTALEVPPQIINGRTKVPLRFVADTLGVDVLWHYGTVLIGELPNVMPDPVPPPTPPAPEPTPTPIADNEVTVWVPATRNNIYHRINNCGRMNPARASSYPRSTLQARGYRACSRCW